MHSAHIELYYDLWEAACVDFEEHESTKVALMAVLGLSYLPKVINYNLISI